jgi:hypothetical protein
MAVVKGPLMSMDARKSVGKTITFQHWKGKNTLRKTVKGKNPKTGLQTGQRSGLRFLTKNWATLSALIQGRWKTNAGKKKITPLNQFVGTNQSRVRRSLGLIQDPTLAAGAVEAAPTVPLATAAVKSLVITWVDSAGVNDWATFIFRSTAAITTPQSSQLVGIVGKGTQTFTDLKLTSGTVYHYKLQGTETGGTIGTATADFTGTPS